MGGLLVPELKTTDAEFMDDDGFLMKGIIPPLLIIF